LRSKMVRSACALKVEEKNVIGRKGESSLSPLGPLSPVHSPLSTAPRGYHRIIRSRPDNRLARRRLVQARRHCPEATAGKSCVSTWPNIRAGPIWPSGSGNATSPEHGGQRAKVSRYGFRKPAMWPTRWPKRWTGPGTESKSETILLMEQVRYTIINHERQTIQPTNSGRRERLGEEPIRDLQ
jgi:hypothetical protein